MEKQTKKKMKNDSFYNKVKKFRWHDPYGRQLTAGGILPYDDNGMWAIVEKKKSNLELSDMGGKYHFEDGDIYFTIAREFCEELYHSVDVTRKNILDLTEKGEFCYILGYNAIPVYGVLVIHTDELEKLGIRLCPELFSLQRKKIIAQNPHVPDEYYSSVELKHIPFADLKEYYEKKPCYISNRLSRIIKNSLIYEKMKNAKKQDVSRREYIEISS